MMTPGGTTQDITEDPLDLNTDQFTIARLELPDTNNTLDRIAQSDATMQQHA